MMKKSGVLALALGAMAFFAFPRRGLRRVVGPGLLLLGAAACSSTSPTQACADISNAVCAKIEACAPAALSGIYGDTATCASRTQATCGAALALKNTGDTSSNVEDCSKAYASLSCTDALGNALPKECAHTPGTLGDAATCGTAGQCKSGVCQFDSSGCGKCITAIAAGGTCNQSSDCQSGLVCAPASDTSAVCIAPASSGATCSTKLPIVPCQAGLVCDSGKCAAALAPGSACDPAVQPTLCDQPSGYFCTPKGTRCTLALAAGTGAPCGYDIQTGDYSYCEGSGFCGNVDQQTGMGTCIAPAADGAACDFAKGPSCLPPAYCSITTDGGTSGTCVTKDPASCQ